MFFKAWVRDPNSTESCLSQKPLSSVCLGCSQASSCLFSVRQRMKPRYMTCCILPSFRILSIHNQPSSGFLWNFADISLVVTKSSTNIGVRTLDNISPNKVGEIFSPWGNTVQQYCWTPCVSGSCHQRADSCSGSSAVGMQGKVSFKPRTENQQYCPTVVVRRTYMDYC